MRKKTTRRMKKIQLESECKWVKAGLVETHTTTSLEAAASSETSCWGFIYRHGFSDKEEKTFLHNITRSGLKKPSTVKVYFHFRSFMKLCAIRWSFDGD